ncbi:uncharacterized protein LOC135476349 [Liolophura sinensis]|uniref:uncharacterized protein LOC135476349 n=1 Tax=Liolophura sinensis TaxID=3198878 RepID=UPI0031590F4E
MLQNIVSVSSVCLLLAIAGWDRDASKTIQENIFDPSIFETYTDNDSDTWDWFGTVTWSGEVEPCPCRWSFFFPGACPTRRRDELHDLGIFSWVFHRVIYSIEDLGAVVDGFAVGNAVWLLLSIGAHITLYIIHAQGTDWKRLFGLHPKKQTKDSACQKNTNIYRKINILRLRHREELEEMAKTIEYLERERQKQEDYLEQKKVEVDILQNAIRHLYHAHAQGDVEKPPKGVKPDCRWD